MGKLPGFQAAGAGCSDGAVSGGNSGKGLDTECIWRMDFTAFPKDSIWGVGKELRRTPYICTVPAEKQGYYKRRGKTGRSILGERGGFSKVQQKRRSR